VVTADLSFEAWWGRAEYAVSAEVRKGLNSLITLGACIIWKLRNDCVFIGAVPNMSTALNLARDEAHLWCLAGAKGLSLLPARGVA